MLVAYFWALRAANVPAEIHVFEEGGHGFGIARTAGKPDAVWPDLFLAWSRKHGFFTSKARARSFCVVSSRAVALTHQGQRVAQHSECRHAAWRSFSLRWRRNAARRAGR